MHAGDKPLLRGLTWGASFAAFPLGGLIATFAVGRVDDPLAAVAGGAIVGVAVGAAQALASWRRLPFLRWTAATTVGVSIGLALGASAVGYATTLPALAVVGAVTGLIVGALQSLALPRRLGGTRLVWVPASAAIWAIGWSVTTLAGVGVDRQFAVFGATGALAATLLSGVVLMLLARVPSSRDERRGESRTVGVTR
jgi:hypothetical protein